MAKEVKAGSAFIDVIARLDKLESGMNDAKQKVEKAAKETESIFTNTFGKLKNIGVTLGLAYGTSELVSFTKEAVIASAKLEVLRANFRGTAEDIALFRAATAGTVSEANLIKLSNQASDLGISLQDQTILFSLAEDSADKYGTSVEEGMMKVIAASEGSTKGLKALGIQKAVYQDIVKSLAKAQGDEFKNLDAEIQKQIQVQAIIKATGITIEDVANKVPDAADKIEQFYVGIEELKTGFGEIIREGLPQFLEMMVGVTTNTTAAIAVQNELNQAIENEIKLRKMQSDLYKDTISHVGDLAENETKGKSSSQLTSMIAAVQEKISNMKRWAQKSGFTDDTKNDLDQQMRRLNVYKTTLDLIQEKDIERSKKLQEQRDKDLAIEKEYYTVVSETGSVSLEQILSNVDKEVTERYKKLSEAAKKEVDLEKWKNAERLKAEDNYFNNVIKKSPEYQKSQAVVEGKNKPNRQKMIGASTLGDSASKDQNPFIKTLRDINDELDNSQRSAENFASTISSGFVQGIAAGENFGQVLVHLTTQIAEMVAQATVLAALMSIINPSNPLGFLGFFGKALGFAAQGGPVAGGNPYIVGEKGPELFFPGSSGYVLPNNMLQSINSSNSINNITNYNFSERSIVDKLDTVNSSIQKLNKVLSGMSLNLDGKKVAEMVTIRQNAFDRGNVKFR